MFTMIACDSKQDLLFVHPDNIVTWYGYENNINISEAAKSSSSLPLTLSPPPIFKQNLLLFFLPVSKFSLIFEPSSYSPRWEPETSLYLYCIIFTFVCHYYSHYLDRIISTVRLLTAIWNYSTSVFSLFLDFHHAQHLNT